MSAVWLTCFYPKYEQRGTPVGRNMLSMASAAERRLLPASAEGGEIDGD